MSEKVERESEGGSSGGGGVTVLKTGGVIPFVQKNKEEETRVQRMITKFPVPRVFPASYET